MISSSTSIPSMTPYMAQEEKDDREFYTTSQGRRHGGGKGGKSPPKDFKKGENEKIWGIFMHQGYKNLLFCHLLNEEIRALEGLLSRF